MFIHSVAFVACLMTLSVDPPAETEVAEVKAYLTKTAQPISVDDGSWIDPYIKDQRVVLIGEEVHGIAEHIHLKAELARRLITRHGFTHIFLEDDVFKAKYIHDNLQADAPKPAASLFRYFFWCWNVTELHEFFDQAPALTPIPAVHGVDVQTPAFAIHFLKSMAETDEQLAAISSLEEIFKGGRSVYAERTSKMKTDDLSLIESLSDNFAPTDIENVQRHLRRVQAVWVAGNNFDPRMNARDLGMSEAVMDILRNDPASKAVIFVHNAHAGYVPFYEAATKTNAGIKPLGKHLRDREGVKTLSIGAVFATGSVLLDPRAREENGGPTRQYPDPEPGTQADYWFSIPHGRWLLDAGALADQDLSASVAAFFNASPAGYFDNYGPARPLISTYDLIVGYRQVTPATPPE